MANLKKITAPLLLFYAKLTKKEKKIFYVASAVVLLMVFDKLVVTPVFLKMRLLNQQIVEKETEIKKNMRLLAQKDHILALKNKYKGFLTDEDDTDVIKQSLIKDVESLANKTSIYLIDIKPTGIRDEGGVKKYNAGLNFEAEMEEVTDFIHNIESSKSFLTIKSYQITPKMKNSSIAKCSMTISKIVIP